MSAAAIQPKRPLRVMGNSMSPTYHDGQWLLTEPIKEPLKRGDVVVIDSPDGTIIKRIALLPGDRHMQFRLPTGWVETLTYGIGTHQMSKYYRHETVPAGTIFVLGDHLSSSIDSRSFGAVKISDVKRIVPSDRRPSSESEIAVAATKQWSSA